MGNLPNELRARARYGELIAVLGQPRTPREAELLVFIARWLSDEDVRILLGLVRAATGRTTARDRLLVVEIGELLDHARPRPDGSRQILLDPRLAHRIRTATAEP